MANEIEKIKQMELMDEVMSWSAAKIYNVFGAHLEKVILDKRDEYCLRLKTIWRHRAWYTYADTAEQVPEWAFKEHYFDIKKIKKYTLFDIEDIFWKIERELIYSNPKKTSK